MKLPACSRPWATVCLLLVTPFAARSADVLLNPGFEAGTANWSGISASSSYVHSGTGSGRLDQQFYFKQAYQNFACTAADLVSFGGYIQTDSIVSGDAGIRVTFFDAANQSLQTITAGTASGTSAFALKEVEGVIPPSGTTSGRLVVYTAKSTTTVGTAYFDDLYVDVFSHKSTVVSSNGGFEDGVAGWYQGHAVLASGADVFEGDHASAMTHGSYFRQSWFEFPVTPAQEYAVSFAFATDAATSNGQVMLRYYDAASSQISSQTLIALSGTNPYALYYGDGYYPPANATTGRLVFAASQPGTGTSYLDNVLITTDQGVLVSPAFIDQQLTDLTPDAGFESGVSNWSGGAAVETTNVADDAASGRFAGYSYYKAYTHALIPAQAGKHYALTFLAALTNLATSPSISFEFYDAVGTTKLGESGPVLNAAGNTGYYPYASEYFEAPASTAFIKIKVSIPSGNPGSFVYLDNVHLYEAQNLPVRAVSTYGSIGVYASLTSPVANELAHLYYRVAGATVWSEALEPVYDSIRREYRGSIVGLAEDTDYEVQVVLEAAGLRRQFAHAGIQLVLPRVAERRVAQVVGQRDGLGQVFREAQAARQGARDLGHFQAVGQARAEQVAFMVHEDLGLVFQAPEGAGVDDAVAVALEFRAVFRRRLDVGPPARLRRVGCIGSQLFHLQHRLPGGYWVVRARTARTASSGAARVTASPMRVMST